MAGHPASENPLLTQEDRDALVAITKVRHGRAIRHVREAGLKPWMRSFAAWFALEGNALTRNEQLVKARFFAKDRMRIQTMMVLFKRPDFTELVDRYTEHSVEALRAELESHAPAAIEAAGWAIAQARAKEDYKAIPQVVEPILSRVIPKKDDTPSRPPILIVNLGTGFAAKYADAEMQEPEVIELPPPKDDDSTDS